MMSVNSTNELGQPWVMISGVASGFGRADVQEVDRLAVDGGGELREAR